MSKKKVKHVPEQLRTERELMHWAWTIIANAYEGHWTKATPEWRDAADTWRDQYHIYLDNHPLMPTMFETPVTPDEAAPE